jgi:hypothetical protein
MVKWHWCQSTTVIRCRSSVIGTDCLAACCHRGPRNLQCPHRKHNCPPSLLHHRGAKVNGKSPGVVSWLALSFATTWMDMMASASSMGETGLAGRPEQHVFASWNPCLTVTMGHAPCQPSVRAWTSAKLCLDLADCLAEFLSTLFRHHQSA